MLDDPVAAAYPLARAAIVEALGPEGLGRVALQVTQHAPEDSEPTLCVALARTEAAHEPAAWQASCSVAWSSTWWGMVSPRAWAVLRLITKSNSIGCSTGRSAGLAPLRMRST